MWICLVVTPVWYKVSQFCFFCLFLYYFKNQNIYLKKNAVKAAKSNHLQVHIVSKSTFERFNHRNATCKTEFFYIHYFWKTKCKSTTTIKERCFSCQNKSVCQKLAQSCKKMKIGPISDIHAFAQKPLIRQSIAIDNQRPINKRSHISSSSIGHQLSISID